MTSARQFGQDRRAAMAIEFALVFPVFIVFVFGTISMYGLANTKRAMDLGLERALRYASINGGGTPANVKTAFYDAARILDSSVGNPTGSAVVTVSTGTDSNSYKTVTVSISYAWTAPANYTDTTVPLFLPITLAASGTVRTLK